MLKQNFDLKRNSILGLVIVMQMGCGNFAKREINYAASVYAAPVESLVTQIQALGFESGLSIAIVTDRGLIYQNDFGYSDIPNQKLSTDESMYYMASISKAFMGLTAAKLADEGVVDLDASIASLLPTGNWGEVNAAEVTLREILGHRAGWSNEPIDTRTAYSGEHTPELLLELLADTDVSEPEFDYRNFNYILTGMILEHATGKPWQDLVTEVILEPLGMNSSVNRFSEADPSRLAKPNIWLGNQGNMPVYLMKYDNTMHAAGGMYSTTTDMARLIEVELTGGSLNQKRIFPESVIAETQRKNADVDRNFYQFHRTGYGIGWYISDYEGENLVHHFGSFSGARPHVSFMPEHNIGVAVFMNDASPLSINIPDIIAAYIYDLNLNKTDLDAKYAEALSKIEGMKGRIDGYLGKLANDRAEAPSAPSNPLEYYTGTYVNRLYGTLEIKTENNELVAYNGNLHSTMTPRSAANAFRLEMTPLEGTVIRYVDNGGFAADSLQYSGSTYARIED